LGSNCIPLDETQQLIISCQNLESFHSLRPEKQHKLNFQMDILSLPHSSGCIPNTCEFCSRIIVYIAGAIVKSIQTKITCSPCGAALYYSLEDPCNNVEFLNFRDQGGSVSGSLVVV
jgi:hypothetical protein